MKALVRRFLKALGQKFNGTHGAALIDEEKSGAARITKAAGSFVFKGANTPLRPQRRSGVISAESDLTASLERVQKIATEYALAPGGQFFGARCDDVVDHEELKTQVAILKKNLDRNKITYSAVTQEGRTITLPCICPNAVAQTTNTAGGRW